MNQTKILNTAVIVSALGYFVDIYDLVLFSIVRVESLKAIGVPSENILEIGVYLLNSQMIGMLVGGLIWGILGDKKGRVSVLFGSIFLYSTANILNAFVQNVEQYAILRFIAGVGLAGELGAAITLVSEVMSKETRGIGTTIVASVGICGAVLAGLIGDLFSWKIAYAIGGVLGLLLLILRMKTFESTMFSDIKTQSGVTRGQLSLIFCNRNRFARYIYTVLIGLPIWFVIGILITFSPELAKELGILSDIQAGRSILFCYVGLALGDVCSGLLSQALKSRKKAVGIFLLLTFISIVFYSQLHEASATMFYSVCVLLGFAVGYWAVFVTIAAEQFGTNLRATVTTTAPNFIRGSVVPLTLGFQYLHNNFNFTLVQSACFVGIISMTIACYSLFQLKETFSEDLNYIER